jgi:hypothetical protein
MKIAELEELLKLLKTWIQEQIPRSREEANDALGRKWICKSLGYAKSFKLKDLQEATDRQELNALYVERFAEKDPKQRKGISALKTEISALYEFQKCFTSRYKGRMHFYRDDLSQKGKRNMSTVGRTYALFKEFKKNLDA